MREAVTLGACAPRATLTSLTDPSSQEFSGEVTDAGCGATDFTVASRVDGQRHGHGRDADERPDGQPLVRRQHRPQRGHRRRPGDVHVSVATRRAARTPSRSASPAIPATPFLPAGGPYPYDGVFTDVDASTRRTRTRRRDPRRTRSPSSPTPSYGTWNAKFSSATVVDPQRTEGEPLDLSIPTALLGVRAVGDDNNSFIHRSTNDGQEFHLVPPTGARPDLPPGGGDTDIANDDHGNVYFADLEARSPISAPRSRTTTGMTGEEPGRRTADGVDRQWFAVDNGPSSSAVDNTVFLAFHQTRGRHVHLLVARLDGRDRSVGGLVWQNSASCPGALEPLAADAICAKLRFDPVTRNLYYACNEGNHIRVTVGHVGVGQRTGIQYANYNGPRTPGGGSVLNLFPRWRPTSAGNVYVAWIDKTNSNLYYSFSTDRVTAGRRRCA